MANSQKDKLNKEFADALENGEKGSAMGVLRKAFINAVELKIKTTVKKGAGGDEEISTKINLLEGDIETSLHEVFAENREKVAQFHQEQVNKAEQIIARNVQTLKELTKSVIDLFVT